MCVFHISKHLCQKWCAARFAHDCSFVDNESEKSNCIVYQISSFGRRNLKESKSYFIFLSLMLMFPCIMMQYTKMTHKMQLCRTIYYSLAALHVLSNIFAHHQEHINPLNTELNPICHLLALLGAHPILHVSGIRVNCIYSFWYYTRVSLLPAVSSRRHTWIIPEAVNTV